MRSPMLELRKSRKMSQNQLSMILGCSKGHLSDIESGAAILRTEIIDALNKLGVDGWELNKQHEVFMKEKRESLERMFKEMATKTQ